MLMLLLLGIAFSTVGKVIGERVKVDGSHFRT
jgi:hypothetical protein